MYIRRLFTLVSPLIIATSLSSVLPRGVRAAHLIGPGKYEGVVVFNRWGTCFLVSGSEVTYVAADVSGPLLPFKNTDLQLEASIVTVLGRYAGYGMIHKYRILGPPSDVSSDAIKEMRLRATSRFLSKSNMRPRFTVELRNGGHAPLRLKGSGMQVVLFRHEPPLPSTSNEVSSVYIFHPAVQRGSFMSSSLIGDRMHYTGFTVDVSAAPPPSSVLEAGQVVATNLSFKLDPGQYQAIFAYTSGDATLVSNALSFDVSGGGRATPAK